MEYALQVFAGKGCRKVNIVPEMNEWVRVGIMRYGRVYRSGFYEIGFVDALQNTPGAADRAEWTMVLEVGEVRDCPEKKEDKPNPSAFGGRWG